MKTVRAACFAMTLAIVGHATASGAGKSCEDLASLALPDAKITRAEPVTTGTFEKLTNLPAFCRVAATLTPSVDSAIKMEVWMPLDDWNGKFVGTGNGGAAGAIFYWEMAPALARGYAVANSDTGHEGGGADWTFAIGHPEKLVDSGHRAVHEMTVQAKAIIAAHYGMPARTITGSPSPTNNSVFVTSRPPRPGLPSGGRFSGLSSG